ncbi:hypothetical protein HBB16_02940 [Pseudonocardia sp. MCCB 268]|nr:hypothetical protein [Pseudonocardia cytotoxica]
MRGTVHRLTTATGRFPHAARRARVRARLAHLASGRRAVWVDDAAGEDAVCVAPLDPHAAGALERVRHAAGAIVAGCAGARPRPDDGSRSRASPRTTGGCWCCTPAPDAEPAAGEEAERGRGHRGTARRGPARALAWGTAGSSYDVAWSPDWFGCLGATRPRPACPGRADPGRRRRAHRGHAGLVPRQRPGSPPTASTWRSCPGVGVRPVLRPARLRPDLRHRLEAVPGTAGRSDGVAVRGEPSRRRPVDPGRRARRPAGRPASNPVTA